MLNLVARYIQYEELPELLQLYKHLHHDDPELNPDDIEDHWNQILNDPLMKIIVVIFEGKMVASCVTHLHRNLTRSARPYGLIENVVTHAEFRRRGFARLAINQAITFAQQNNCYKLMLMTGSQRPEVHAFYESCGFQKGIKTGFFLSPAIYESW